MTRTQVELALWMLGRPGMTDVMVAQALGVPRRTLRHCLELYQDLTAATVPEPRPGSSRPRAVVSGPPPSAARKANVARGASVASEVSVTRETSGGSVQPHPRMIRSEGRKLTEGPEFSASRKLTVAEQAAVDQAVAEGKVTRIANGEWPDADRLNWRPSPRARPWTTGRKLDLPEV